MAISWLATMPRSSTDTFLFSSLSNVADDKLESIQFIRIGSNLRTKPNLFKI
jgi:hypothetical protein